MTEKKADKKEKNTKKAVAEKIDEKKTVAKETKAKKESEAKTEVEVELKKEKGCAGKVWLAIILTFLFTSILFGVAFFVFMNLEVMDRDGTVRIDHGKIYVDNRWKCDNEYWSDDGTDGKDDKKEEKKDETGGASTSSGEIIANPNPRATVKNAQLVEVGDFEFYLPTAFRAARGNGSGKYVFNLVNNDSGWADVKVYAEKTNADLLTYMSQKDSSLELTDSTYYMNGTSWAEMESGTSLAYGTRLGEMIYVVILNVRLESDATGEAEQMIPKTIRLKKIYK